LWSTETESYPSWNYQSWDETSYPTYLSESSSEYPTWYDETSDSWYTTSISYPSWYSPSSSSESSSSESCPYYSYYYYSYYTSYDFPWEDVAAPHFNAFNSYTVDDSRDDIAPLNGIDATHLSDLSDTYVDTSDLGLITDSAEDDHDRDVLDSSYSTSSETAHAHHHNTGDGGDSWTSSTPYVNF
jgi:hypothetical protein